MPSKYTGSSFELLFRTAELAKFSKEEQKMIDAAQKAKWDAYAIQSYREKESARLQEESARLQEESVRLQEESARLQEKDVRLQKEKSRLQEENARVQAEKSCLQEENARMQEEAARLQEEKRHFAKLLKESGVPLDEIADRIHLSKEELKTL